MDWPETMARSVAIAVVREDPPEVFVAEDEETLNWVIALKLISRVPGSEIRPEVRDKLRDALANEQWGEAVRIWIEERSIVDVYPSHSLYLAKDVELAPQELEFSPLFQD